MPTDSPEASGPHKCKLLTKVTTNGDPEVEQKRKRLEVKEQSTKPAPPQKHFNTTTKAAVKSAPQPQHPSVEIGEVEDESANHTSAPPHNPQHILEAANGSEMMSTPQHHLRNPQRNLWLQNSAPLLSSRRFMMRQINIPLSHLTIHNTSWRLLMGAMMTRKILSLI